MDLITMTPAEFADLTGESLRSILRWIKDGVTLPLGATARRSNPPELQIARYEVSVPRQEHDAKKVAKAEAARD